MMLGAIKNTVNQKRLKLMLFSGGILYREKRATRVASRVPRPYIEIGITAMLLVMASIKKKVMKGMWMLKSWAMRYISV